MVTEQLEKPAMAQVQRPPATTVAHRVRPYLLATGGYLVASVIVWWNVWSSHPTSTTTCGCGDSSTFVWYLAWPAYALAHGLNPLYSTALFHPGGVNLLSNTSVLAIGVVLAPVTWIFGVVATFNVALTLSPVLSALAMFALLRRWVSWSPAAFFGGLFYGFSPFIIVYLTDGHLMIGMAAVPPLFVACLDELLVRQRRRPIAIGVLLALLVTLQFFIGTEIFLIMVTAGAAGVVLLVGYAALRHPEALRQRIRYAMVGISSALIATFVLLAYPIWFALDGPAHLSGPIWPPPTIFPFQQNPFNAYLFPTPPSTLGLGENSPAFAHIAGGYQGPILSSDYLGLGVFAVLIVGIVVWRRDRRLWLFGLVGLGASLLYLGFSPDVFTPWRLLSKLPQFGNVVVERFTLVTFLAAAVMLGLIIEHTYLSAGRPRSAVGGPTGNSSVDHRTRRSQWTGAAAGVIVAVVAVFPPAAYLAMTLPVTTQAVVLPAWFQTVAPHLTGHQVLLVLPTPFSAVRTADMWQAVDEMHYSTVGGPGPGSVPARAGKERAAQAVISGLSYPPGPNEPVTTADIGAVRRALHEWGVTMVVIPDQPGLPAYDKIPSVTYAAAVITAATGMRPLHEADAWVWPGVGRALDSTVPSAARLSDCTKGVRPRGAAAVDAATRCVLPNVG